MSDQGTDELVAMSNALGGPVEKKINEFNKKAAGRAWNAFKRALCTATEPFFRIGMGERYCDGSGGIIVWPLGCMASYYFENVRSLFGVICIEKRWYSLAAFFNHPGGCIISSGVLLVLYFRWLAESKTVIQKHRNEGMIYHSMSRGLPRFSPIGRLGFICAIMAMLLAFNLVTAVLFVVALIMNQKIVSEQQSAIWGQYLDAIDRKAEDQYLEQAALGECPLELTYLIKPLDPHLNPTVRSDVAGSMVGKPVKGVAKPPTPKT